MQSFQLHPLSSLSSIDIQTPTNPQTSKLEPNKITKVKLPTSPLCEEIFPNISTLLHTSIHKQNPKLGSSIHAQILKSGLQTYTVLTNSLLNIYAKCGHLENSTKLFESMPNRTIVTWTTIISAYCHLGFSDKSISLFCEMLEDQQPNGYTLAVILKACAQKGDGEFVRVIHCWVVKFGFVVDQFLQNSLISAYAECGELGSAERLLDVFVMRDVVSWTSVISGCVRYKMVEKAIVLFLKMQEDGVMPNEVTILSILQACSGINDWHVFQWIHGLIMKKGWCNNSLVMNSLVEMYCTNGYFEEGVKLYCKFCFLGDGSYLSPETMATLLHGCGNFGLMKLGEEIHGYLIKHGFFPCTIVENSLINMYAENERDHVAFKMFSWMSTKDIISWNTMITCLVRNQRSGEALDVLRELHTNGERYNIWPDFITMLASIQACSNLASLQAGQIIHGYVTRAGLDQDIFIQNSFIDLYAKSGRLDFAKEIFKEMSERDIGSWNSMIAAYGFNGNGTSALQVFSEMQESEMYKPNKITFSNVLSACAHAGLVKQGFEIFNCMSRDYGVEPSMEHYACMVDLLGRSGRLDVALVFIENMPLRAGPDVCGALLGACAIFGHVEIAEIAAKKLSVLELNDHAWRVALSNVYASAGRWEDAAKVRVETRGSEVTRKEGGWSGVEVRGELFKFMAGDINHPESKIIYKVLHGIHQQIRERDFAITEGNQI